MSRRLEIELTSERPDGTWTWRAAGARQPKGELAGAVLPPGAKVGDVVRADADFAVDGIEIVAVLPPKATRKEPERLVVVGTRRDDEPLVTTQLAPKGRGGRRERRDRDDDDRDRRDRRDRGERRDRGDRAERSGRPRGPRPDPVPERPKPKRLRPGRTHRSAVLAELPAEQHPIADQVLRGGVPAVREAIAKQNEQARAENRPEVPADQLVALAEQLLPRLRAAEWRDKAEAALADLDLLDLRDLRSVVVAADGNTRDDESRALLAQLQEGLARRVEEEQANWVEDLTANLDAGRFVRALRLSSRPPKAGTPLPPELATRLIESVSAGLTPTVNQELWAAAVDALAYSPVRNQVTPVGRPEQPSEALLDTVRRVGDRLPAIVELFGLDPAEVAAARRRSRSGRGGAGATRQRGGRDRGRSGQSRGDGSGGASAAGAPAAEAPASEVAAAEAPASEVSAVEVPVAGDEGPGEVAVPAVAEAAVVAQLEGEPGPSGAPVSEEAASEPTVPDEATADAGEAAEPDASQPDATESDATESDASQPDAAEPDAAEPDAAEPDAAEPAAAPSEDGAARP